MTLKEILNSLPPDIEEKVSGIKYWDEGICIDLYWKDEDDYINSITLYYYDDGAYNFSVESWDGKDYSSKSNTVEDVHIRLIKEVIEAMGGKI